jgi:hypothetical protein
MFCTVIFEPNELDGLVRLAQESDAVCLGWGADCGPGAAPWFVETGLEMVSRAQDHLGRGGMATFLLADRGDCSAGVAHAWPLAGGLFVAIREAQLGGPGGASSGDVVDVAAARRRLAAAPVDAAAVALVAAPAVLEAADCRGPGLPGGWRADGDASGRAVPLASLDDAERELASGAAVSRRAGAEEICFLEVPGALAVVVVGDS